MVLEVFGLRRFCFEIEIGIAEREREREREREVVLKCLGLVIWNAICVEKAKRVVKAKKEGREEKRCWLVVSGYLVSFSERTDVFVSLLLLFLFLSFNFKPNPLSLLVGLAHQPLHFKSSLLYFFKEIILFFNPNCSPSFTMSLQNLEMYNWVIHPPIWECCKLYL